MKKPRLGINTASKPSGDGCVECLAAGAGGCTSPMRAMWTHRMLRQFS